MSESEYPIIIHDPDSSKSVEIRNLSPSIYLRPSICVFGAFFISVRTLQPTGGENKKLDFSIHNVQPNRRIATSF
jgi:hypothetical protein